MTLAEPVGGGGVAGEEEDDDAAQVPVSVGVGPGGVLGAEQRVQQEAGVRAREGPQQRHLVGFHLRLGEINATDHIFIPDFTGLKEILCVMTDFEKHGTTDLESNAM